MTISLRISLFCLIILSATIVYAQPEDLTTDASFFEGQKEIYQKWLDHSGFGETISVHSILVKPEQLTMYLQFPFTDTDSVINAWNQLKVEFEEKSPLTLEQELFFKMISIMEINRQASAVIQLYDTYDAYKDFCFKRKIFSNSGEVIVEEEVCKAKLKKISFDITDFRQMKKTAEMNVGNSDTEKLLSPEEIRARYPKAYVFDTIFQYAKKRFETTTCEFRNPKVSLLNSKNILRFKVIDLCKEVLKSEENPKTCQLLRAFGHECNWIKRERLIFTFTYEETEAGFTINTIIDGAYGSGYYEHIRRGGYYNMEVDFDNELEDYANEFKEAIRSLLRKK